MTRPGRYPIDGDLTVTGAVSLGGRAHPLRIQRPAHPPHGPREQGDEDPRGGPEGRPQRQEARPVARWAETWSRCRAGSSESHGHPPPSSAPEEVRADRDLDLRYYADLLWRARSLVAAAAVVGALLGLFVAFLRTPEYRAGVMLQIDPPTPTFMSVTDALMGAGAYWQNADFYNTQFKVLRSKGLGEKVVKRLKLDDQPPFKDNPEAGALFMSHVGVEPYPESRLVTVSVTHPNPKEAALWANTLAEVYIESSLEGRVETAKKAYEWLQERLTATQASMREAQDKLFKSYEGQDLFVPEGSVSAVSTSITKLNEDYIAARTRRITIEAAVQQARDMRAAGREPGRHSPGGLRLAVVGVNAQIAGLNVDLSRLLEKYKPAHPEVQKIEAQLAEMRKAEAARAEAIVGGLQAEYAQLQKRENELRAAIDGQKSLAASQSRKASELDALKKEAESSKSLYEVLLQKLNESDIAASIRSNNVSVVEQASAPRVTGAARKKRKMAILGLLLGLALGVGLVLARDYLDNTLRDPEEVERYLHLDLLAAVPQLRGGQRPPGDRGLPEPPHRASLRPQGATAARWCSSPAPPPRRARPPPS